MPITVPTDAYCTLADVNQLLPTRVYNATSKPSQAQAEQSVRDIAEEISSTLRGLGYGLPPTDSEDLRFFGYINKLGAAALIEAATISGVSSRSDIAILWQQKYDDIIDKLSKGKFKLNGLGSPPVATPDGNDDLDTGGDREDPIFSISDDSRKNAY